MSFGERPGQAEKTMIWFSSMLGMASIGTDCVQYQPKPMIAAEASSTISGS